MSISDQLRDFIFSYINSVEELEILLLLYQDPSKVWSPAQIGNHLSTQRQSAADRLTHLEANGLVKRVDANAEAYQFSPRDPSLSRMVNDLAQAYPKYRVRIIELIFSKPIDKIRTFADAFRFRKEEKS